MASTTSESQSVTPSWKTAIDVSIARSRKVRGGNYVQLATVDQATGEPRVRTVVFRGFLQGDNLTMKMITDRRSSKVKEAGQGGKCELLYWFGKTSEQYRIRGALRFVGDSEDDKFLASARKQQWGNLSDKAREQFFWDPPGVYSSQGPVPEGGRDADGQLLAPPKDFLLVLLRPSRIDYLRLTDNYRSVDELDAEQGEWSSSRINP